MTAIYKYKQAMRWFTRPKEDPSIKQLATSNPLGFPEHMIHEYEGGQLTPEEFYQWQSIPQSERPLTGAEGGRVQYKPGGLVEPGVVRTPFLLGGMEPFEGERWKDGKRTRAYKDYLNEQKNIINREKFKKLPKKEQIRRMHRTSIDKRKNLNLEIAAIVEAKENEFIKAWEKNTGLNFDDVESENSRSKIRRGKQLGIPPDTQFKPVKLTKEHNNNIKIWEKNTGKKYKTQTVSNQWKIRTGTITGAGKSAKYHASILAIQDAFMKDPNMNVEELAREVFGSDFDKGSLKQKRTLINYLRQDVPKFLEALAGTRKVPGFKKMSDDIMLDTIDNINSHKKMFGFADETLRQYNFKIRDMTLGLDPNTSLVRQDQLNKLKKGMGLARDETAGLAATFERAPGWTSGTQLISDRLNTMKSRIIDKRFSHVLQAMIEKDPNKTYKWTPLNSTKTKMVKRDELVKLWNEHSEKFKKKHKIDAPTIQKNVAPKDAVKNFKLYSKAEQTNMNQFFKTNKFSIGMGKETSPLKILTKSFAEQIARGPEGIKFLNKQATAQTMWKLIGNKGKKKCSTQLVNKAGGGRIGFQGQVCGLAFATEKPTEYMAAVKKDKEALNAFKAATAGKDTSKVLKAARWVMRDLGNPVGWIGSELIISGGITAAMLGEGYTTRESIDQGLAWFLPKSVLKAELHKIRDMAEKEGVDFETLMPFLELESIAEEHDKHKMAHLKNTSPFYAWSPQNLQQISFKMFGKKLEDLTEEELKQIPMPSASGRGGEFYRKQAIDSSVLGMGTANKKYSDLLRKIQKPFGKDDLRYALPYSQLDELRNVADMTQTEKAKANELAALKSEYDKRLHYTRGQGKQTSFQDWVHQRGKGDLLFNEFQRGPDRREMLTWSLFNDIGAEPYKMPFPEKAPIDFSAAPYEEGGRVAFGAGGIDKGRRAFMKWLAGITGAGVAAGTGLLKWGKIGGKGTTAIKAGDKILQGTPGMPDWFIPLVNRITKEGDNVTQKLGTVEREIVHTKKIAPGEEVTVYQNLDTGNVRVDYTSPDIMGEGAVGPVSLEYRAGEVITEGKHAGKKTKPEFEAVEPEPVSHTHGPDDYSIEWDGANVVGRAEDLMSDTNKLKQFATKKKPTMGEIVESSKKKKEVQKVHENESDYIVSKQGEGEWDDYLPDIDDMDY